MDNRDKIKQGLRDAAACARGECDCKETTYRVRNRSGRAAVTNLETGETTIYPMPLHTSEPALNAQPALDSAVPPPPADELSGGPSISTPTV
jgi:hypothetical protein